ncbi:MAG: acyl-CoA dehydrogenase family protein [Candidatus Aminicenantales bacterium]
MNFDFSEEQRLLREMVREFAQKEIKPEVNRLEERGEFPQKILNKLGKLGILGMTTPPHFGGMKTDYLSFVLALEELAKVLPSVAVIVSVHCSLFCYSIFAFGTQKQKEKYLPPAARGNIIGAFALTEPQAGSDATNLKSRSEKKGKTFFLNGAKSWITTGADADAVIIMTRKGEAGKKKLNAFIVEKDFPGFSVTKIEEKMGLHSSPTAEILLENCRVPEENLLGEEGMGARIAFRSLDYSRVGIAAQSVGICQRALEEAVTYAKQREAFGKKISEFQSIQFMIADMATLLEAARLLTYRAAELCDRGKSFTKEASMAKLYASEAANRIAYLALQIHGGYGYSKEFFVEQLYRDARVLPLYEGTSEIQRLVIARNLLKDE